MNYITKTLLGSAALCALATAPSMAAVPAFHVTALHAGHAVNKTLVVEKGRSHLTYTFGVSSYVPASDLNNTVHLIYTYYKWNSNDSLCTDPKEKIKVPKQSEYATLGTATETYDEGCSNGSTKFYGDTYDLTNSAGDGQTDSFTSKLIGKFENEGTKYKGTLNLDVDVHIGE
jgi:hypothetical protein